MLTFIAFVLAIGIVIGYIIQSNSYSWDMFGFTISVICAVVLLLLLLGWVTNYTDNLSNIQTYYAVKQTVEESRDKEIDPIERATLTRSIIEINSWLKKAQYWNNTIFGQVIPDEVMELEPIK